MRIDTNPTLTSSHPVCPVIDLSIADLDPPQQQSLDALKKAVTTWVSSDTFAFKPSPICEDEAKLKDMVERREFEDVIDKFVQRRSRWMVDFTQGDGYELLTTFEDTLRLAFMLQLDHIKHRCANFFNGAVNSAGFGSKWHTVALGLSFASIRQLEQVDHQLSDNWRGPPLLALADLMTKTPGYEDKDTFWLRSMLSYYATRPNYQL
ncbi:MAG: hypothetical protein J3R72DRAFT_490817 [Linnemannia gamsii]|nr:MAG: hypothetical protein J3R72DRAFT_490817 [Linnemannia gamsii]